MIPEPSGEFDADNLTLFDILERDGRITTLHAVLDCGPESWANPDFRRGAVYLRRGE